MMPKSRGLSHLECLELVVVEVLGVVGAARDDEELHAVHGPARLHALAALAPEVNSRNINLG